MFLTDVIEAMTELLNEHGDLPVVVYDNSQDRDIADYEIEHTNDNGSEAVVITI